MTIVAFFDIAFLRTLPGRTIKPAAMDCALRPLSHATCGQPHEDDRKPFTVGLVRVRTTPKKATLELCDRRSNPLIEVDVEVHNDRPDAVCDLGYGVAPGTVIDEGSYPYPYPITMCCGRVNRRRTRCGGLHVVRGVLGRGVCDGHSLHVRAAYAG